MHNKLVQQRQNSGYGLTVRLPYIVTCARLDTIKRVCSEPPCCSGVFLDLLSVHDNFGDENGES